MKTRFYKASRGNKAVKLITLCAILLISVPFNLAGQQSKAAEAGPPPPPPPPPPQKLKLPMYLVIDNDTIYQMTEENAQFPGGTSAMESFRDKNTVYPPDVRALGIRGSITVSFIVEKDGSISNARILRGLSPALDAEALRVTSLMPKWIPGKEKGKPVRFTRSISYVFGSQPTTVQYENEEDKNIFVVVEQMPMFPGGDAALLKFIAGNVKYPEKAKSDGIQGRVIVRFCITDKGNVERVSVIRGVDPELDTEAIRVVKMLPAFEPGKQGGVPVSVWFSVPITYSLRPEGPDALSLKSAGYDTPPSYPGGEAALHDFIASNVVYPESARLNRITGRVLVNYCITPEGKVSCVSVYKGVDPVLDAEAVRVISKLSDWQPARLKGTPVTIYYQLAVNFSLQ